LRRMAAKSRSLIPPTITFGYTLRCAVAVVESAPV
jgi:hypothetical protein